MTEFTLTKDADGVATITWDVPGKTMNVMSFDGLAQLNDCIDQARLTTPSKGSSSHRARKAHLPVAWI